MDRRRAVKPAIGSAAARVCGSEVAGANLLRYHDSEIDIWKYAMHSSIATGVYI
jgi:hypothetical protein